MEGYDRRTILGSLGAFLALAALLPKEGPGPIRPERATPDRPQPQPRITLPEGSVKRRG
jgi:hypothetical protein